MAQVRKMIMMVTVMMLHNNDDSDGGNIDGANDDNEDRG